MDQPQPGHRLHSHTMIPDHNHIHMEIASDNINPIVSQIKYVAIIVKCYHQQDLECHC